jgi:hypothetical protein
MTRLTTLEQLQNISDYADYIDYPPNKQKNTISRWLNFGKKNSVKKKKKKFISGQSIHNVVKIALLAYMKYKLK